MRILFVLDQLPYPPRNGVTIPTCNFLLGLSASHEVSLLYIQREGHEDTAAQLLENERLVKKLWKISAPKSSPFIRIGNELRKKSIYHMGREYDEPELRRCCGEEEFDVIWVSDDGILDIIYPLKNIFDENTIYVAGINDAITGVFRGAIKNVRMVGLTALARLLLVLKWLRSWWISSIETRLLAQFDLTLVQSEADHKTLVEISKGKLDNNAMILSNGVDSSLFSNSISQPGGMDILFVGSLIGYGPMVEWLIVNVWPKIKESVPGATFTIVGRGAAAQLEKRIGEDDRISNLPFVDDIRDVYKNRAIALLPVQKSWGLINKVVESMAAGVPVVGYSGSFNSIPEFENGIHGVVAAGANDLAHAAIGLLRNEQKRADIAVAARKLVRRHFSWDDRVKKIEQQLTKLAGS